MLCTVFPSKINFSNKDADGTFIFISFLFSVPSNRWVSEFFKKKKKEKMVVLGLVIFKLIFRKF